MLPCSLLETAGCKEGVGSIAGGGVSGSRGQQSEQEKVQEDKGRRDKDATCNALFSFVYSRGDFSKTARDAQLVLKSTTNMVCMYCCVYISLCKKNTLKDEFVQNHRLIHEIFLLSFCP